MATVAVSTTAHSCSETMRRSCQIFCFLSYAGSGRSRYSYRTLDPGVPRVGGPVAALHIHTQ